MVPMPALNQNFVATDANGLVIARVAAQRSECPGQYPNQLNTEATSSVTVAIPQNTLSRSIRVSEQLGREKKLNRSCSVCGLVSSASGICDSTCDNLPQTLHP